MLPYMFNGGGSRLSPSLGQNFGFIPPFKPQVKTSEQLKQKKTKGSDEDFEDFCYKNSDLKKKIRRKKNQKYLVL